MFRKSATNLLIFVIVMTSAYNVNAEWVEKWNVQHNQNLRAGMFNTVYPGQSRMEADFDGDGVSYPIFYSVSEAENVVVVHNSKAGEKVFEKNLMSEFGPSAGMPLIADIDNDGRDEIVFVFGMRAVAFGYRDEGQPVDQKGTTEEELAEQWNVLHDLDLDPVGSGAGESQTSGVTGGQFYQAGDYGVVVYTVGAARSDVVILNGSSGKIEFKKDLSSEYGSILAPPFIGDFDEDGQDEIIFHTGTNSVVYEYSGSPTDVQSIKSEIPEKFEITQNYPNPFNPTTTFSYSIPTGSHVTIEIINVLGQRVRTLVDERKAAGVYEVDWDGDDSNGRKVSSGVYFYRFQAGDVTETKKMVLLK